MRRESMIGRLGERRDAWDMVIVGGGATGLGAAVDAASRGYAVCLLERSDFAKGTSSRSTKLVHGGVRYLQQGNVSLVMEALRERGRLLRNAPHIVSDLEFVVPSYAWWESPWYGIGMKVYDTLAGRYGFGKSKHLSREEVVAAIPSISRDGLRGGTRYYDGQFDDARLAINLASTAADHGATLVNYCGVVGLMKDGDGVVGGVVAEDSESGVRMEIPARVVINATGAFTDSVRRMDDPDARAVIRPSQGAHIVLPGAFLPGRSAIMVPHTDDGRVMFAIPWHGVCVVGTTDTPVERVDEEPVCLSEEVDFILETANRYLARDAERGDILSVFAGIRPLVRKGGAGDESGTSEISRDHTILIDQRSGLVTIAGGKWTTYRRMAEEVVDQAALLADLSARKCVTRELAIHGSEGGGSVGGATEGDMGGRSRSLSHYGSDAAGIRAIVEADAAMGEAIHARLPVIGAEVVWACRSEMARTVEDVLARRTRCVVLDARASIEAAGAVGSIMAGELGRDAGWARESAAAFERVARGYLAW
ncbi:MAG: glycerol-3-phosphate dehydrogenase/oxidase [Phycisphaerales bacterium]